MEGRRVHAAATGTTVAAAADDDEDMAKRQVFEASKTATKAEIS